MHRLANRRYCMCDDCIRCGCAMWWRHHEHIDEIVPNTVRKFDAIRHYCEKGADAIQSLWRFVKRMGAVQRTNDGWRM